MWRLLCVMALCVQGVWLAPVEEDVRQSLHHLSQKQLHELADSLVSEINTDIDLEKRATAKRELLEDATKMTRALIEQEKVAAQTGTENESIKKLLQFLSSNPRIKRAGLAAHTQLEAIKQYREVWLQERGHLEDADFWTDIREDLGPSILLKNPDVVEADSRQIGHDPDTCPFPKIDCTEKRKHRTIDGTCNNLVPGHEHWGSAHQAQIRLLEPDYADDIESPRVARDGGPLPSARLVSKTVFEMDKDSSGLYTLLNMVFGQFLDHDISHTPAAVLATDLDTLENATVNCGTDGCSEFDGNDLSKKECFPIHFPENDVYQGDRACMPFTRSQAYLPNDCFLEPRQQANTITSWLDASMVYGSDMDTFNQLVDSSTGEMKMMPHPIDPSLKPLLPPSPGDKHCTGLTDIIQCFHAGDVRQNEVVSLTAMHTVFVRMHNHIHDKLSAAYATASVSKPEPDIFLQEVRRILSGLWQHVVYNEYLRALLGPEIMNEYDLEPKTSGFLEEYDDHVRSDVSNAFAAAAFRFGHSEIPDMMRFASKLFDIFEEMHLSEILFSPHTMYHSPVPGMSAVDAILLGMINAPAEDPDPLFCGQIKNHLFTSTPPFGAGLDLPALNIQRARDHGIPGYVEWREFCHLPTSDKIRRFPDMRSAQKQLLQKVYSHADDVDLFAGAMLEDHAQFAQVGPTFGCILAEQFWALKFGDRFYYENKGKHGFTEDQLEEIRKFTLARLMCDTLDDVGEIQKYVLIKPEREIRQKGGLDLEFLLGGDDNHRRPCVAIDDIDYSVFVS